MKIYGVSTNRNGAIVNTNYDILAANGFDTQLGLNYHIFYPVEIPTGTNSMFAAVTTAQVDAAVTAWKPNGMTQEDYDACGIQERMILIYNDSNQTLGTVNVFISDQQFTGCVAEITPWNCVLTHEIQGYSSIETLSTSPVNQFPENVYFKANFQGISEPPSTASKEIVITNMQPYSWYVAALRLYIVKDVEVLEDYCVIATETT